MTLARQIGILLAGMLLVALMGSLVAYLERTRTYFEEQLASHAQDTATSLGLSLSVRDVFDDPLTVASMVDAVFDRGYYREIRVEDTGGQVVVSRQLRVRMDDVPDWFVKALRLQTPTGQADVISGWRQRGRVHVRSHPGFAYQNLWSTSLNTLAWCVGTFIVALILAGALLRRVLAPLRAVEAQAQAIMEREFPQLDSVPRTRELARVVRAMNRMCAKVRDMLAEETGRAERFREAAFTDPVTGLANRSHFERRLAEALAAREDGPDRGVLLLAAVAGLEEVNRARGYAAGNECLRALADALQQRYAGEDVLVARAGGTQFAILLPSHGVQEARAAAQALLRDVAGLRLGYTQALDMHVGIGRYTVPAQVGVLLAQCDMALRRAQSLGAGGWHALDAGAPDELVMGAQRWREVLLRAIETDGVCLAFQPVCREPGATPHAHEVLARITGPGGETVAAGVFLPMAARLRLIPEIDRTLLGKVLRRVADEVADKAAGAAVRYEVNLSRASLEQTQFAAWLDARLSEAGESACARLSVEISERDLIHTSVQAVTGTAAVLRRHGVAFGVDQFGVASPGFGYLQRLKPAYLKVDASYVRGIDTNAENQFFVASVVRIAHGLDIHVVAEAVETRAESDRLLAIGADALKGYLIGRPSEQPAA